ncbi:hypothetical protein ACQ4PT_041356 [Festuca glaucescens]
MASSYKMKGIFKSFRIISQMFASKEQEMEIGCPTDVKHVAHIGWNTSTGTLSGNAPPGWMTAIGGSSDFRSMGNFAIAAASEGTSWASQDFEPRDMSPLGLASEITGQDATVAPTCGPDAPRPTKKIRRRSKRTTAESPATSSVSKDSSASADDARGTCDMVMQ